MSIKRSCDFCRKEFTPSDDRAGLVTAITPKANWRRQSVIYHSFEKQDTCEKCGEKVFAFLKALYNDTPKNPE